MGLHSVEELVRPGQMCADVAGSHEEDEEAEVTGKRSEGKEDEDFQGGVYEAAVNQEKQDDRRSHREMGLGGGLKDEVSLVVLNTDGSGRLKLETVDDLFNILQMKKRRRERKAPVHKKQQPEPENLPETVDDQLFLTAAMENKLPVVEKYLSDGGNPNAADNFQRTALHKASFKGHVEVMKRLLEAGAALEKKDKVRAGGRGGPLGLQRRQPSRPAAPPRPGSQDHLQRQAEQHSAPRRRADRTLRVRRASHPLRSGRQRQRQRWRHAHARRCENKQVQDDQAADDVRSRSQHEELRWKNSAGDVVLVAERSQEPPLQLQRGEAQNVGTNGVQEEAGSRSEEAGSRSEEAGSRSEEAGSRSEILLVYQDKVIKEKKSVTLSKRYREAGVFPFRKLAAGGSSNEEPRERSFLTYCLPVLGFELATLQAVCSLWSDRASDRRCEVSPGSR
ncbi:uncharacterized protein ankrd1a isoform X2 [Brachyistius frenatus]|uniref:uncharacterized protein ankrd1a isoform X2 n=1 Tax=Brachyistius frenatus TaxID=100188 RepID=UPI0037E9342B